MEVWYLVNYFDIFFFNFIKTKMKWCISIISYFPCWEKYIQTRLHLRRRHNHTKTYIRGFEKSLRFRKLIALYNAWLHEFWVRILPDIINIWRSETFTVSRFFGLFAKKKNNFTNDIFWQFCRLKWWNLSIYFCSPQRLYTDIYNVRQHYKRLKKKIWKSILY